jgi:hypothetical protein
VVAASWPAGEREKGGGQRRVAEQRAPDTDKGATEAGVDRVVRPRWNRGGECGPIRRKKKGKWVVPNGIVGFSIYSKGSDLI